MSPSGAGNNEETPARDERLAALRNEFVTQFGEKRGQELFRQVQTTTLSRVGADSWINVLNPSDVRDILKKIWEKGLAGLSDAELLTVDDHLSKTIYQRRLILRFLRHYIEDEEYAAVDTAYQLIGVLRDRSEHSTNRSRLVRALYDRIGRLHYGNRILNRVSVGWLETVTYPQMRALEAKIATAGRARGPEAEAIKQIFYRSLEPEATRMWIRSSDDPTEIFGEIAYRLLGGGPRIPYLDLYATSTAERVRDAAVQDFLESYRQFEQERHDLGAAGGFVRLRRKSRP